MQSLIQSVINNIIFPPPTSSDINKTKIQKCSQDAVAKQKILEAKLLMLAAELDKVKEQDEMMRYNEVVAPDAVNMDEDRALVSLTKAKAELEDFYRNYNATDGVDSEWEFVFNSSTAFDLNISFCPSEASPKSDAKAALFASIRRAMQSQPNLVLYRTIHKSLTNELESLLQRDIHPSMHMRGTSGGGVEESIAQNISDAYQRFILRSTQLDAEREALHTITDNYEHLYTEMNDSLNSTLPDTKKALRDDFIRESSHLHLNEGRLQFLQSEIARNKELLRERSDKIRDMVESQETVKEVVRKSQAGLASMVGDMKQMQKISNQLCHMRDLTERHLVMMKGDFKPGNKIGGGGPGGAVKNKKFNTCM